VTVDTIFSNDTSKAALTKAVKSGKLVSDRSNSLPVLGSSVLCLSESLFNFNQAGQKRYVLLKAILFLLAVLKTLQLLFR